MTIRDDVLVTLQAPTWVPGSDPTGADDLERELRAAVSHPQLPLLGAGQGERALAADAAAAVAAIEAAATAGDEAVERSDRLTLPEQR